MKMSDEKMISTDAVCWVRRGLYLLVMIAQVRGLSLILTRLTNTPPWMIGVRKACMSLALALIYRNKSALQPLVKQEEK